MVIPKEVLVKFRVCCMYIHCAVSPPKKSEETEPGLNTIHCRWIISGGKKHLTQHLRDVSGPSIYPSTVHQNHNERVADNKASLMKENSEKKSLRIPNYTRTGLEISGSTSFRVTNEPNIWILERLLDASVLSGQHRLALSAYRTSIPTEGNVY